MRRIAISSGHGLKIRGASGYLDEVNEARRVVDRVYELLHDASVPCVKFHDNVSTTQSANLNRIVNWHNAQTRDLDVSVHFNAYKPTSSPMGTECLYVTQQSLSSEVSASIASVVDLPDRGAKKRTDLAFLNGTAMPAILVETVFVDSSVDASHYQQHFEDVCYALADVIGDVTLDGPSEPPPERPEDLPPLPLFRASGPCSWFGGPEDTGVGASEGLAFIYEIGDAPHLFLPYQPNGTTGLARRLNPHTHFIACRWNYDVTPKPSLLEHVALVRNPATGVALTAFPADWGPNADTGRVADLSKCLMDDLKLTTDATVEVIYPYEV